MFREIVPNLFPVLAPDVVLTMAATIGVETGLSMLGFGLPIETPSLGTLISNAMVLINLQHRWWNWFPAIALIFVISLSINFVGQAIQRVADPRQRMV
jgi:peptide/nickel transport system permease protein